MRIVPFERGQQVEIAALEYGYSKKIGHKGINLDEPFKLGELCRVIMVSRYWDICEVISQDGIKGAFWWWQLRSK